MSEPIYEFFIEIQNPIFTSLNYYNATIDSYRNSIFLHQEPPIQLNIRQEFIINETVTLHTYPVTIDYTSPVWSEIQNCINNNNQNANNEFIVHHQLVISSLPQHPQHPDPIPDTPESPDYDIISDAPLTPSQSQVPPSANPLPHHRQSQTKYPQTHYCPGPQPPNFFHSNIMKTPFHILILYPHDLLYLCVFI